MSNANGSKWIRPAKRLAIYARDGFACIYCGATEGDACLTLDHVTPRELGGTNDATNLVTACLPCNSAKRDTGMREWFAMLRDRGVDIKGLGARIARHTLAELDMNEGRHLLAARKG